MRFSERSGFRPVRDVIQIGSIDEELKNGLWSVLKIHIWDNVHGTHHRHGVHLSDNEEIETFCGRLWFNYYKKPLDTLGDDWGTVHSFLRHYFFECEWFEVYDFIEFTVENYPYRDKDAFISGCNIILERECSAYRIINGLIAGITDEAEVEAIEQSINGSQGPVRTHLQLALQKLSSREKPDYRNSIKESISAIESLAAIAVGEKGTLGQLTKKLEEKTGLHPALVKALSNLYGYTSDEDGIRHAILESKELSFEDAKFFLVICSAFANLITAKIPDSK
jgi:hypothetical protein